MSITLQLDPPPVAGGLFHNPPPAGITADDFAPFTVRARWSVCRRIGEISGDYPKILNPAAECCRIMAAHPKAAEMLAALKADPEAVSNRAAPKAEQPAGDVTAAAQALAAALAALQGRGTVDAEQVRAIVAEELDRRPPAVIEIHGATADPITLKGAHPLLPKVLALLSAGLNVALIGPPGCGKTHMAAAIAEAMGVPFVCVSYSEGLTETALMGRTAPDANGAQVWQPSGFCLNYERPSVTMHDEADAADPNLRLALNAALANGAFWNPIAAREFRKDAKAWQLAGMNTYGRGATAAMSGRNRQDDASLDRWYPVEITYDPAFEASLFGMTAPAVQPWQPAPPPTAADMAAMHAWHLKVRAAVAEKLPNRSWGTRNAQRMVAARRAGVPFAEIKRDLLSGWTRDELAKVGE